MNSAGLPIRVASLEVLRLDHQNSELGYDCELLIRRKDGETTDCKARGDSLIEAVCQLLRPLSNCDHSLSVIDPPPGHRDACTVLARCSERSDRQGIGRFVSEEPYVALVIASLRALSHAGFLKSPFRANNQKTFRQWSSELQAELAEIYGQDSADELMRTKAQSAIMEHFNRVASAAVITATNYPRPDSILSLFDTSSWLYDNQGNRRASHLDTDFWLAWYPGIENESMTVDEIIRSMPAAPPTKIPRIVKLFENPSSPLRFRGAVDLEDHDVLHVLLGRGLQDQDEAFVIGFAMGTAKRVSGIQYWVFRFVISRLYPEPYRIPTYLRPAFDLGVQCGKQTGARNLYASDLKTLRDLPLTEARQQAEIDMDVVRSFYEQERQQIPFTIASLRLP